jgi:actin-related protein
VALAPQADLAAWRGASAFAASRQFLQVATPRQRYLEQQRAAARGY